MYDYVEIMRNYLSAWSYPEEVKHLFPDGQPCAELRFAWEHRDCDWNHVQVCGYDVGIRDGWRHTWIQLPDGTVMHHEPDCHWSETNGWVVCWVNASMPIAHIFKVSA